MRLMNLRSDEFHVGGLIGLAKLESHVLIESENQWLKLKGEHLSPGYYGGPCYGWEFSDAISLRHTIECPGELGLFRLKNNISQRVLERAELETQEEFVNSARGLISVPTVV